MLNTALLSRMSQKSQHTRYEEIILGRTCCEEAPQVVPACHAGPAWQWIGGQCSGPDSRHSGSGGEDPGQGRGECSRLV